MTAHAQYFRKFKQRSCVISLDRSAGAFSWADLANVAVAWTGGAVAVGQPYMPKIVIVVREVGRLKPDYSLDFDLPAVPREGEYISIARPDAPANHTEDLLVRKVWWMLKHPEIGVVASDPPKVGGVSDIIVECDQAIGPYARDAWRDGLATARERGIEVHEFEVSRFSVRESDLQAIKRKE